MDAVRAICSQAIGGLYHCQQSANDPGLSWPTQYAVKRKKRANAMPTTTVGLLYPGHAAEDDFPLLQGILGDDVRLPVVHTSVGEDAHRVDALLDLGSTARLADGAEQLRTHSPVAVVWACTSGSFVFGWDGARAQVDAISDRLGCPASSTSIAFVNAIRALGVRRVAIAATYPRDVVDRFVEFLDAGEIGVVDSTSADIVTAAEVGTLGRDGPFGLLSSIDHRGADVVLVPDTALHTVAWLDELETAAGKPVLTANQVSVWEGLRLAGRTPQHDRLGSLFRVGVSARIGSGRA
jgi:maleate cis-trans isomerase